LGESLIFVLVKFVGRTFRFRESLLVVETIGSTLI